MEQNHSKSEWLEEIDIGSRHSFELFYEKYISYIYGIAYALTKDPQEAEDIAHDVFLEVIEKYKEYNPDRGSIKAWLAVKTKSRSLDRLRKKKPLLIQRLESVIEKSEQSADAFIMANLEKDVIFEALNHIPKEQREAIIRSYFKGETQREIAQVMNKPLGTVKSLIRYGLNNLRKQKSLVEWIQPGGGGRQNDH